jgi:hypothetical protein
MARITERAVPGPLAQRRDPISGTIFTPPPITPELITYLRQTFPLSVYRDIGQRDLDVMIGQQAVISHLEAELRRQEKGE